MNPSTARAYAESSVNSLQASSACSSECFDRRLELPEITPEARLYALKELARRAGVGKQFFKSWNIDVTTGETALSFGPEISKQIHFLHGPKAGLVQHLDGEIPVPRTERFTAAHASTSCRDVIVPFCSSPQNQRPLFEMTPSGTVICRLDLLASIVLTLSRVEESLKPNLDEHGRFPAASSLAFREKFLERPILDEHGLAFREALTIVLPGWRPQESVFRMKLTHDIDDVGIPFNLRSSLAHTLKRRNPLATARDLLATLFVGDPVELSLVRKLAEISRIRGLHSAFFWKSSPLTSYDSGYPIKDPRIQRVISELHESKFEVGVHPGYHTFHHQENLAREIEELRNALQEKSPGGRQHYLRWSPQTWHDWESCGLRYDSSVGFADWFGFRAGTSFPFRPWYWPENRELDLIEVPLILMDCTPVRYMRLELNEGLERIRQMIKRVEETGGVFTLLWHNTPLLDPAYDGWYEGVLNCLAGAKAYHVPPTAADLW